MVLETPLGPLALSAAGEENPFALPCDKHRRILRTFPLTYLLLKIKINGSDVATISVQVTFRIVKLVLVIISSKKI